MDRKEFLSLLGVSSGALILTHCMGSCKNSESAPNVDFTIDISTPQFAALNNVGGSASYNGVVIAKTAGGYVAVAQACTHEGAAVNYQSSQNRFYCPRHGATFSTTGAVTGGPANSPLKQYTCTLTGTLLRVNG
jgi:cytochrome b6-f complex iron-sulfur subunit